MAECSLCFRRTAVAPLVLAGVALVAVVVALLPVERALVVLPPAEGQEVRVLVVWRTAPRSDQIRLAFCVQFVT